MDWITKLGGQNAEDTFAYIKNELEDKVKQHISTSSPGHKTMALWMSYNAVIKVKRKIAAYRRYLLTAVEGKDYVSYVREKNQAKWEVRKA